MGAEKSTASNPTALGTRTQRKNGKGGELNVPSFLVPLPLPAAHPSLKEGGWGDISCPCEFYRKINPCVSDELTVNSSKCVVL